MGTGTWDGWPGTRGHGDRTSPSPHAPVPLLGTARIYVREAVMAKPQKRMWFRFNQPLVLVGKGTLHDEPKQWLQRTLCLCKPLYKCRITAQCSFVVLIFVIIYCICV